MSIADTSWKLVSPQTQAPSLGAPGASTAWLQVVGSLLSPKSLMVVDPKNMPTDERRVAVMQPYVFPSSGYLEIAIREPQCERSWNLNCV